MGNILTYKGFTTKILIDLDDDVIYGKIEGIDDLVVFEGDTVPKIKAAFYLMWRNTPCFSYGDISHTLYSPKDCTDASNVVQSRRWCMWNIRTNSGCTQTGHKKIRSYAHLAAAGSCLTTISPYEKKSMSEMGGHSTTMTAPVM